MVLNGKDFSREVSELDSYIDSLPTTEGKLITVLHKAQGLVGFLPTELQSHVARKLGIPSAKVYGVVTFYSFFTTVPKGKYRVSVCMGTACFVRGAQAIQEEFKKQLRIDVGGTSDDFLFSLDALRCVGACGLAPVVMVNDKIYGRVMIGDIPNIIEDCLLMEGKANG